MKKIFIPLFMFLFLGTACTSSNIKSIDSTQTTSTMTIIDPSTKTSRNTALSDLQLTALDLDEIDTLDLSSLSPDALEVKNITVEYFKTNYSDILETIRLYLDYSVVREVERDSVTPSKIVLKWISTTWF